MNPNKVIMIIMAVFFAIGAADRCFGNRLGMGSAFERGFFLMGKVGLSIMGLICLTPVLADYLTPIVVPLFTAIGTDPGMFPSIFLSPDSGGWAIARELSSDTAIADFSGLIVAAVMGGVVSFSIPAAVGIIQKEDTKYLAVGIMASFIVDPIGCFFGGLAQGLAPQVIVRCLVPVTVVGLLLAVGLALIPGVMIRGFQVLSKFLMLLMTIGLILGAAEKMTGFAPLAGMRSIDDAFKIVGSVTIMMAGTLPLVRVIELAAKGPLNWLAEKTGVSGTALSFGLASLASIIPGFTAYREMNVKGKVFMAACAGSISNVLGPHLGFAAAANQELIVPMLVGKTAAGILAVPLALWFGKRLFKEEIQGELSAARAPENC